MNLRCNVGAGLIISMVTSNRLCPFIFRPKLEKNVAVVEFFSTSPYFYFNLTWNQFYFAPRECLSSRNDEFRNPVSYFPCFSQVLQ